jgi:hypothetical protein
MHDNYAYPLVMDHGSPHLTSPRERERPIHTPAYNHNNRNEIEVSPSLEHQQRRKEEGRNEGNDHFQVFKKVAGRWVYHNAM